MFTSDLRLLDPTVQIICSASLLIFDSPQDTASFHRTKCPAFLLCLFYWNYIDKCIEALWANSPGICKNRAFSFLCLLRLNDSFATPWRIALSNWLLKLEIAKHIHYLMSECVLLVINKAGYSPSFHTETSGMKKRKEKKRTEIQGLSRRESPLWNTAISFNYNLSERGRERKHGHKPVSV